MVTIKKNGKKRNNELDAAKSKISADLSNQGNLKEEGSSLKNLLKNLKARLRYSKNSSFTSLTSSDHHCEIKFNNGFKLCCLSEECRAG